MNIIRNRTEWNEVIDHNFPENSDVYFRYEFFDLFSKGFGGTPNGILWEDDNVLVFWTNLIRNVAKFDCQKDFNRENFNLTTPYGYGGPLIKLKKANNNQQIRSLKSLGQFMSEYQNYCRKNEYKTEFVRFHPFAKNWEFFLNNSIMQPVYKNEVIYVDLTNDEEIIFSQFKKTRRKNIRRAKKRNLSVNIERNPSNKQLNEFMRLYYSSMDRKNAEKRYYFSKKFVKTHFNLINTVLIETTLNERTIASLICIYGKHIIHTHLTGLDYNFRDYYPSDLVHWEAIRFAINSDLKFFHFGGGGGGISRFKRGFSETTNPFYIAKLNLF